MGQMKRSKTKKESEGEKETKTKSIFHARFADLVHSNRSSEMQTRKVGNEWVRNRPFSYSTKEPGSSDIFIQFYTRGSIEWR